ncbi:hypothetical protein LEMLEM_LOCUS1907 [Lemmus lemmus]
MATVAAAGVAAARAEAGLCGRATAGASGGRRRRLGGSARGGRVRAAALRSLSLLSLLLVPSSLLSSPLPPFCSLPRSPPWKRFNCLSTGDHPAGCWGWSPTQGPEEGNLPLGGDGDPDAQKKSFG